MTKSNVFTAVYRDITPDECGEITRHPKWSAGARSHAIYERNEAQVSLESAEARIAQLEADLAFQKSVTDAARQQQAELLTDAERYRWMRRRAVMMDCSDETVTTITLFKEEGPTGEFLDDQIDGELAKEKV